MLTLRLSIGEQCKTFRTKAIAAKARLINIESFCEGQTWQMVVERLEEEATRHRRWKAGKLSTEPSMTCTDAIQNASEELGLDLNITHYAIRQYARRNELMHCRVSLYIKNCDWKPLAIQLHKDIQGLPGIFGPEEHKHMLAVLELIRDRYFFDFTNPWNPIESDEAVRLATERRNKRLRKAEQEKLEKEKRNQKATKAKQTKADSSDEEVVKKKQERSDKDEDVEMEDGHIGCLYGEDSMDLQ